MGGLIQIQAQGALILVGARHDDARPKTRIADGRDALSLFSEEDKEILRNADFQIKVPMRWRGSGATEMTDPVPILTGSEESPDLRVAFYPDMVVCKTERAQEAFDKLHNAVNEISGWVDIKPGAAVMVNNRMTLHSRDRFEAHYDEKGNADRWLQRVFTKNSLGPMPQFDGPGERIFDLSLPKNGHAARIAQEPRDVRGVV